MTFAHRLPGASAVRRTLALAAVVMISALAGCAEPPPPAPPPPPPPSVSLSPALIQQASAYRYYMSRASAISPAFVDGAGIADGVRVGAAYEPTQFLRGMVAYGAVVALQDQAFVAGVRTYAGDATQRRTVAYEIMKDPAYAVGFAGSASAAGRVMAALGDDGRKLLAQGKSVKQAAYDLQRSPWSKSDVQGRDARLQLAKQLSTTPTMGDVAETTRLQQAVLGASPLVGPAPPASPPYTQTVIRSLAVAALAALGYADDAGMAQLNPILAEPNSATCLNMSKLNLYQCLAVAKPHYEDVFCLGQHVLMDTGKCVMKSAGAIEPLEIRTEPLNLAAAQAAVPVKAKPKPRKGR